MLYMYIFWIIIILNLITYLLLKKYSSKYKESISLALIILAWSFLIVAIVQKDPIFTAFGVPQKFEWVVGLFITALSSWKLYFDPLKQRVIHTEKEVTSLKTDISSIKEDTTLIKEKLISK